MSGIDLTGFNFDEVVEPQAVEAGEYQLRIIDCSEPKEDKNGNMYIMPRLEVVDVPTGKDFTYFLGLPSSEMDAKQLNKCLVKLKNFGIAFGVDMSRQVDVEELVGLTGWAILGVESNEQYGDQNYVKKFIAGA